MVARIIFKDLSREIMDVDHLVLVDAKVVAAFTVNHLAQMIGYLAIMKLELAMLHNFGQAELQPKGSALFWGRPLSCDSEIFLCLSADSACQFH